MDMEVLTRYAGARLLKAGEELTPGIVHTLDLPEPATFSFSPNARVVLPKPTPKSPLDNVDVEGANTIHILPEDRAPEHSDGPMKSEPITPVTDFVYLAGAEGLYRSQSGFAELFVNLRSRLREDQALFCPMLSLPHRYAIYTLLGVDLFDSAAIVGATREEKALTPSGWMPAERLQEEEMHGRDLLAHNTLVALHELAQVRQALRLGELRLLAEARAVYDPWASALLRILDRDFYEYQEASTPVHGPRLPVSQAHAMHWPEIRRYRERFYGRYKRPEMTDVLLLLPCSATKPYSLSRGHKKVHDVVWEAGMATRVHEVIITSPMGVVPRELETFYPNMQYDTPVTGNWSHEEKELIGSMLDHLTSRAYEHVILHLPESYRKAIDLDGKVTCEGGIGSHESLQMLHKALGDVGGQSRKKKEARERLRQDMVSRLRYQFGEPGEVLAHEAEIKGRYPDQKIITNGIQMGMLTKEKGQISLTLDGGKMLAEQGVYCVEIEDFSPRGDIFAVGVKDAGQEIRLGDDVVVVHGGEVRAVGVASMTAKGMKQAKRGVAVKTRSHV